MVLKDEMTLRAEIRQGRSEEVIEDIKKYLASTKEEPTYAYTVMAEAYIQRSQYLEALDYAYKALDFSKEREETQHCIKTYMTLSIIAMCSEEVEKGMKWQFRALKLSKRYNDPSITRVCYNNLSHIYGTIKDYTTSIYYADKALELCKVDGKIQLSIIVSSALINKGESYYHLGKIEEAKACFLEGIEVLKQLNYKRNLGMCYFNLGKICRVEKAYDKAINYMEMALEKYIDINFQDGEASCYEALSEIYATKKDYKNAYIFLRCSKDVADTVLNQDIRAKLNKLHNKCQKD